MAPQIEKQQFQNQSGGYVGVVVIGVKGEDRGIAVEPDGYVWLSEEEQRLTANAPRRPEDNPFVAQTRQRRNEETDALEDYEVVPLVPVSEERFVPADLRPVPGVQSEGAGAVAVAQAAATGPEPVVPISEDIAKNPVSRHDEVAASDLPAPIPPPRAAEAAAAAETPQEPPVPPAEETAAASPGPQAEETGAAPLPTGEAPQGEYARAEEVGTPVPGSEQSVPPPAPPAPWSPGSDEASQPPADKE
jgi:hypothetical protein